MRVSLYDNADKHKESKPEAWRRAFFVIGIHAAVMPSLLPPLIEQRAAKAYNVTDTIFH